MDFLAKKHEFVFLNNQSSLVRVHVTKVASSPFNIWVKGKSKNYRDCVRLLEQALKKVDKKDLPPIIIVANRKIGSGAVSSYDRKSNVIYYNDYYCSTKKIEQVFKDQTFASKSLIDIINHELGHKLHWDAVKRFYKNNKSKYNDISEAKRRLDSNILKYLNHQEPLYLLTTVSSHANTCYKNAKKSNSINQINEVVAEVIALKNTSDRYLNDLVYEVIKA